MCLLPCLFLGEEESVSDPKALTTGSFWSHEAVAKPGKSISELIRATPGSAGLDLKYTTHAVLTPEMGV